MFEMDANDLPTEPTPEEPVTAAEAVQPVTEKVEEAAEAVQEVKDHTEAEKIIAEAMETYKTQFYYIR